MQDVLSDLYWAHRSDANVRDLVWREGEVSLDRLLEQDSASLAFESNPVHCLLLSVLPARHGFQKIFCSVRDGLKLNFVVHKTVRWIQPSFLSTWTTAGLASLSFECCDRHHTATKPTILSVWSLTARTC